MELTREELATLGRTTLFHRIDAEEIHRLADCLGCHRRRYRAGETVWLTGDEVTQAGIVLTGAVCAEYGDRDGVRSLAARHGPGSLFGDVLMTGGDRSPVDILAAEERTELFFLPFARLMSGCARQCPSHERLRLNLLREISLKYWQLRRHIECLRAPGLRKKLFVYLGQCAEGAGADTFLVPLDRQSMADHLGVNRSAMCRELGQMKAEGLIDYYRGSFRLLAPKEP